MYNSNSVSEILKNLSAQDFLSFGMHDIAYVRAVDIEGRTGYAVHAADGTPLSVLSSMDEALRVIAHNDLETAVVH
ncbi:MAG: DUF1150 family protein [Alphaproteobacteria bacterium]